MCPEIQTRLKVCTGPGRQMRGDFYNGRTGPANEEAFFERAEPSRHMRGDFSNGPGRAGKKRNEFFYGRVWVQKKEDE